MPNIDIATLDSYSPLYLNVKTDEVVIPVRDYIEGFNITLGGISRNGALGRSPSLGNWTGTVNVFDRRGFFLDKILTGARSKQTHLYIAWNWDHQSLVSKPGRTPTFVGIIVNASPTFGADGVKYAIKMVQDTQAASYYDSTLEPRTFPPNLSPSDIVKQIATAFGWTAVIADCNFKFKDGQSLGKLTHFQFITQVLLPFAVDKNGNHFECWWDASGAFHFHPLMVKQSDGILYNNTQTWYTRYARHYTYFRGVNGEVKSFDVTDNSFIAQVLGAGGNVTTGIDSKTGDVIEYKTGDASGVQKVDANGKPLVSAQDQNKPADGPGLTGIKGADDLTTNNAAAGDDTGGAGALDRYKANTYISTTARNPAQAAAQAQRMNSYLRSSTFKATLVVKGTHDVEIGDIIDVDYYDVTEVKHWLSGYYQVLSVEHSVNGANWETTLTAMRKAIPSTVDKFITSGLVKVPETNLIDPTKVPKP